MKEENKKIIIGRWFKKAGDDELNIRSILKNRDGAPSGICFLSQQMAEKYLKALLIFFDLELVKIYDLIKLSLFLEKDAPQVKEIGKEAAMLNQYYIATRYVGDFPDFSWKDAEDAYSAAIKIKEFVLSKLKS
ncbi:MAG: HEPN domain-containing protein [Patescibacteria group bacterium]|jgi:HEPN domain-containing protein